MKNKIILYFLFLFNYYFLLLKKLSSPLINHIPYRLISPLVPKHKKNTQSNDFWTYFWISFSMSAISLLCWIVNERLCIRLALKTFRPSLKLVWYWITQLGILEQSSILSSFSLFSRRSLSRLSASSTPCLFCLLLAGLIR